MKKGIFLSLFVLLSLTINTGCDKLDITEDLEFEIEFVANSATAAFSDEEIFDAAVYSSVIADYGDKITKIEITEITVWLTSFNGPTGQKIVSSTLSVADEFGAGEEIICTVADQDLQSILNNPIPLTVNQAGIDRFAGLIKNSPHKALVKNVGTASSAPIDFVCKFKFKVKMTANPL
ncbi:MAG: hypothetical protein M0Q51_04295 [Bacteroidales bacterium]|nr:hypothetical protein [Bacteroidales bacterium]